MQITFNTGRLYTREGQIITARYDEADEMVYFTDHSRMIRNQCFPLASTACRPMTPSFLATQLMREYDHGRFTYAPWEKKVERDEEARVHQFRL